jgi:hypothetical protein
MTKRWLIALLLALVLLPAFAQGKSIITVLDFSTDGVSKSEMRTIITLLSSALFQTKSFTVIDVSERDRLLQELQFSVGECSDESCLLEVGRMLSAEGIVVGNIGKVGNRYVLSTKMLETETARTLNTADGIYSNLDALVDDIVNVAKKLAKGLEQPGAIAESEAAKKGAEKAAKAPKEKPAKPPKPVKEKPAREPQAAAATGKYWSLSTGAGLNIPLGATSQALGLGIPAVFELDYNLPLGGGTLALGAVTGFQYQATRKDVRYLYTLLTEPLGASVSYRLNSLLPFSLSFGAMGGVTVNEVFYKEVYAFRENGLNFSAFAAPVIGLGYQISPKLGLELNVPFWLIFFQGALYLGVNPVVGVEIRL